MGEAPAIEAEGLVKHYGKTRALAGFDLVVPAGTVYGLLGPNGAGKTTAVRVFATLLRPDGGRARVLGHDVVTEAAEVRRRIGLTGQYAALDEYLTGRANLVMIGQLSRLTASAARRRADEMLERFSLTEAASRAVKTYSGGMRRRLDLAASLIGYPSVLFLDEPTTGLDPNARAMTWEIVRELADGGTTLLLTTQYLDEADQLARRVAVIDGGTVIAEGTPGQLKSSVGGEHLEVVLAAGSDVEAAIVAVKPYAKGSIQPDEDGRRLSVPVAAAEGLTTRVVRALDNAGVQVNDVTMQRASLDDVFLSLTGHVSTAEDEMDSQRRTGKECGSMTAITAELVPERDVTYGRSPLSHFVTDVWVLTKRSIARIRREPETLADVTFMPVIFILMFAYVFGGAISLPGGGSYHEYLIGGMLGMGLAQTAPGVAVALVTDMSTGLIDRFRSLPMSRWAVLMARSIAELLTQIIERGRGGLRRPGHRLAGAHRPGGRGRGVRAGPAVRLRLHLGRGLPGHDAAQPGGGPADRVPHLPAADVHVQRVRAHPGHAGLAAADRGMEPDVRAGRRLPAAVRQPESRRRLTAWPMQHPELAVLCWSVGMLVVFAPLAVHLYRRKALG